MKSVLLHLNRMLCFVWQNYELNAMCTIFAKKITWIWHNVFPHRTSEGFLCEVVTYFPDMCLAPIIPAKISQALVFVPEKHYFWKKVGVFISNHVASVLWIYWATVAGLRINNWIYWCETDRTVHRLWRPYNGMAGICQGNTFFSFR